jgi:hypothetical protein
MSAHGLPGNPGSPLTQLQIPSSFNRRQAAKNRGRLPALHDRQIKLYDRSQAHALRFRCHCAWSAHPPDSGSPQERLLWFSLGVRFGHSRLGGRSFWTTTPANGLIENPELGEEYATMRPAIALRTLPWHFHGNRRPHVWIS